MADLAGLNRLTARRPGERRDMPWRAWFKLAHVPPGVARRSTARRRHDVRRDDPLRRCRAAERLEARGLEVVVFHATGVGGQSMEGLVRDGHVAGVLDLTTTELADELVGGILSAGPERLGGRRARGNPPGRQRRGADMVNFGPTATVPERFEGRKFHVHNPSVTLMRTTPEENAALGGWMARVLRDAKVPTVVMLPLRGVSALDAPGQPFQDPDADRALVSRRFATDLPGIRSSASKCATNTSTTRVRRRPPPIRFSPCWAAPPG